MLQILLTKLTITKVKECWVFSLTAIEDEIAVLKFNSQHSSSFDVLFFKQINKKLMQNLFNN